MSTCHSCSLSRLLALNPTRQSPPAMSATNTDRTSSVKRKLMTFAKLVWPGALVFIAFDLSVDPEISILKSVDTGWSDLEIVGIDEVRNQLPPNTAGGDDAESASEHIMFGVESVAEELSIAGGNSELLTRGGWAGHFAGLLEGDEEANCWSPYEVNIRLQQDGKHVYGPGSYMVDPSKCSTHEKGYLAFFTAEGERSGDQVVLELKSDESGQVSLLFSGVAAGDRLVGAFTMPNGAPVSGTTILTLVDAEDAPELTAAQ